MAKRRANNPDAVRAYQREQHRKNREKHNANLRRLHARRFFWSRATKLKGIAARDLASLWKRQRGLCALTGRRLDRSAQLDHIIPKALGGGDDIANLQWVCPEVNYAKRDLTQEQFFELCDSVVRWIGERIQQVDNL